MAALMGQALPVPVCQWPGYIRLASAPLWALKNECACQKGPRTRNLNLAGVLLLTTLPGPPPGDAPRGRQRLGRQGPAVAPGRRRRPPGASLGPRLALASDPRSCDSRPRRANW